MSMKTYFSLQIKTVPDVQNRIRLLFIVTDQEVMPPVEGPFRVSIHGMLCKRARGGSLCFVLQCERYLPVDKGERKNCVLPRKKSSLTHTNPGPELVPLLGFIS